MGLFHDRTTWLLGDPFHCLQPSAATTRPTRLVLIGPPGVGKGTQAQMLARAFESCALSTGDIFRTARERSFAPGSAMEAAQESMDHGQLVPDDAVLALIHDRRACLRCTAGFIFNGFPRTRTQAIALDGILAFEHVKLDAVISYDVSPPALLARLSGRRFCEYCHLRYHVVMRPPIRSGICDHCGRPLIQIPGDRPEMIQARLDACAEATAEVVEHYRKQGLVVKVDASVLPERILEQTLQLLAARGLNPPDRSPPPSDAAVSKTAKGNVT